MATKNPTENYLKREREIDSSVYQSPEGKQPYKMSRRGFLKGVAGLAGVAVFGEGLLKQIDAWAQENEVYVYIEDFTESYLTDQFQNTANKIGLSVSKNLKLNLNSRGIAIDDNPNGGIVVWGHCEERYDNSLGPMIYVNIGYKINGRPVKGGVTEYYPVGQQMFKMGEITDKVYSDLMQLKGVNRPENQSFNKAPDGTKEVSLDDDTRRLLDDPKFGPVLRKSYQQKGLIIKGNRVFEPAYK